MNADSPVTKPRPPGLDSPLVPKLIRAMSRANVWIYRLTNGRLGGTWRIGSAFPRGVPLCLFTTTGRKSALPRTTPLLFLRDANRVVVVGSQGGLPEHPQWFLNLLSNPRVSIQIGATERAYLSHVASVEERAHLWPRLVALYPDFASYQSWTTRVIPVVVCEEVGT